MKGIISFYFVNILIILNCQYNKFLQNSAYHYISVFHSNAFYVLIISFVHVDIDS